MLELNDDFHDDGTGNRISTWADANGLRVPIYIRYKTLQDEFQIEGGPYHLKAHNFKKEIAKLAQDEWNKRDEWKKNKPICL